MINMDGTQGVVAKALADYLAAAPDLDAASRAVEREREIRIGMARTGEGREVVAEFLDAQAAMDDEAVLELTDGQPTTLVDALTRYLGELEERADDLSTPSGWNRAHIAGELAALLAYPWPEDERRIQLHNPHYGLALHFAEGQDGALEIRMGSNRWLVLTVPSGVQGWDARLAREVAEAVYRATLARVIPDREHIVQLSGSEAADLVRWLALPRPWSGSVHIGDRLTLNASGDGVWIRTRPYSYQNIPS